MSEAAETENPARYALFKALFLPSEGMSRASVDGLIDALAHELAEKQRAWAKETYDKDIYVDEMTYQRLREQAALIDPHASAGPRRPDEEQP
jgi:hypothetical protein